MSDSVGPYKKVRADPGEAAKMPSPKGLEKGLHSGPGGALPGHDAIKGPGPSSSGGGALPKKEPPGSPALDSDKTKRGGAGWKL